ncbi:YihY/virulence factor BrkB family protein [Aurantiacibacter xanthus]|uniref:YihY/virulence factor BrkB family protein n=1 Tax=Aurantiacibacter xanthus TaxID=1784712 RepID=A0A3A1P9D6_9SPHN|nr:YihY/virulence factor BrkB family protein [Aurantiacibacter xanthus]RIV90108.1 YihY/virulence factor BrkB family protein [Aurantiacibacter xanthus]
MTDAPDDPEFELPGDEEEPVPDLTPEARRREARRRIRLGLPASVRREVGPGTRVFEVGKRVLAGTFADGFIHAGNLAYLAMLAIFPFFISGAALFSLIGEEHERAATIFAVLSAFPPVVSEVIGPVAHNVIEQRSGWLLWLGGLFGLWTVGGLIETLRDMLRRAFGTKAEKAMWKRRLASTGIIVGAVVLLMLSLLANVLINTAMQVIAAYFPQLEELLGSLAWSRIVPALGLFGSLYALFYSLTPARYRKRDYKKWPGVLLVTTWWILVTLALPPLLGMVFSYDATYGSLAGVMIVLFFFWLIGLGLVMGAELNAALVESPEEQDWIGQQDNRARAAQARMTENPEG